MAKAAGQTEPTADEKDPAFLAMQVRALVGAIKQIEETIVHNTEELRNAFSMVDMHQQVLQRITRDLTLAASMGGHDQEGNLVLGPLRLRDDKTLDMRAYYTDWRKAATLATGAPDLGAILWSHGYTVEEAAERANLEAERRKAAQAPSEEPESNYEIEHFGGNLGQNHHEQDAQSSAAPG
jgi:hypothetical protein